MTSTSRLRSTASSARNSAIVRYDTPDSRPTGSTSRHEASDPNDDHMSDDIIDRLTADCVKYLLIISHKKTVIKRADLLKTVAGKQSLPSRGQSDAIIKRVRSEMSRVFGLSLVECPDATNTYIVVNKLPADGLKHVMDGDSMPDSQHFMSALLTTVLALIFMSQQSCPEDLMWRFLKRIGFDVSSKTAIQLNDDLTTNTTLKKLLTEVWVRQMYVKYEKIAGSDPITHEFKWGFRAENEFNKLDVLKFVCNVFADGSQPEFWRTQYTAAIPANDDTAAEGSEVLID
ncbi:unnamed protein product [Medioppia subpectinata]|uniref:MAGE domain-containing protein n=1 Tax=Medioppia subpectinata TaxID=1979941 RepID=A0A7R9L5L9_9ACAR|nr:unnamed protein product [Medioppia subpectinata]CAG2115712.1 unnamed protein product [Medioppia subpectinata]